jgi:predicted glycosyltransferase
MRVWFDLTNTAHVPVLRPLVELLEADGHEVELTARPLSHTLELLDDWGHPYHAIGRHGGAGRFGKARAAVGRVRGLLRFARGRRFDAALGHASVDLPPAARALRIPNATMFDYEWATAQHNVVCRLANRVLVPEAIPAERLARYGARPPKLVRYEGLKEEYYLAGWEPDPAVVKQLGLNRRRVVCVVRTAPSYALYLGGSENELLQRVLRRLADEEVQTVVLARTDEQRRAVEAVSDHFVVPERAVDGSSLVAFADVLVSAGGTMNREAAVLGTPVWSIFEGRLGGVDERLVAEGRLRLLADPAELELRKKPAGAASSRVRREPRRLLQLALSGLGL